MFDTKSFQKITVSVTLLSFFILPLFLHAPIVLSDPKEALVVLPVQPNEATDPLTKSWVIETLTPGQSIERSVVIKNSFNSEKKLTLKGTDATQSSIGTFVVKDQNEPSTQVGSWIKIENADINVAANSEATVSYTITTPEDAKGGEYAGAVVASSKDALDGSIVQSGVRVYLTVPGVDQVVKSKLSDFTFSKEKSSAETINIDYSYVNQGTVYTKVNGSVTLTAPDGTKTKNDINFDTAPGSSVLLRSLSFNKQIARGEYSLEGEWLSSPLISANKANQPDSSENKSVKYSFSVDATTVDAISNRNKPSGTSQGTTTKNDDANIKKIALWVVGALIVAAVIGFIIFFVKRQSTESKENTIARFASILEKPTTQIQTKTDTSISENATEDILNNDY
jgi:hypothetical protein